MKKSILLLLITAVIFISCGKTNTNEDGFYQDIDSAVKQAQKKNQDILVAITMAGDDLYSADLVENVMKSESFKKEILSDYSVLHIDFSQASYEKTVVKDDFTKDEQKAAEQYADIMQKNSQLASMLNVQITPSFYVLSKDKYYVAKLDYMDGEQSYTSFKSILDSHSADIEEFHSLMNTISSEKGLKKIEAIDALYEKTDIAYRSFFSDLIDTVVKLDKKNESGVLSKYLLASADIKGSQCYMSGDAAGASQAYIKICEEEALLPEHKQQAYYMGSYILAMSGSDDYKTILDLLQKAIDADPESESVASIQNVYQYILDSVTAMGGTPSETE